MCILYSVACAPARPPPDFGTETLYNNGYKTEQKIVNYNLKVLKS